MSREFIPISKPWVGEEEIEEVKKHILSRNLTNSSVYGGEAVREYERLISSFLGVKHIVAVNSGTSALLASLMALEISAGDEVIVPSFTFLSTVNVVLMLGAKPVFADITLDNYGLDPTDVKRKITEKTKAIILAHLYGYPAYIKEIKEIAERNNLYLIEDAAQALGSRVDGKYVGGFGVVGCFSTYPTKIITTGEGGFIATGSDELAWKLRVIRTHGQDKPYQSSVLGLNLRLPEVLAAIGMVQMRKLNKILLLRREIAKQYCKELSDLDLIVPRENKHVRFNWNCYTIRIVKWSRDEVLRKLNEKKIGATVYYKQPVHLSPLYKKLSCNIKLPKTEEASKTVLSLPIYPEMTGKQVKYVVESLKQVLNLI